MAALTALLLPYALGPDLGLDLGLDLGPLPSWAAAQGWWPAPPQVAHADAGDALGVRQAPPWHHWRGAAAKVTSKVTRATRRVATTPVRQAVRVLRRARRQYAEALAVREAHAPLASTLKLRGEAALEHALEAGQEGGREGGQQEGGHSPSGRTAQFFLGTSAA